MYYTCPKCGSREVYQYKPVYKISYYDEMSNIWKEFDSLPPYMDGLPICGVYYVCANCEAYYNVSSKLIKSDSEGV